MIEEERAEGTSADMSEAIEAIKSASPSLAQEIGSAGITPEKLAEAHQRATSGGHDRPTEQG
jgi:hypothetical protein